MYIGLVHDIKGSVAKYFPDLELAKHMTMSELWVSFLSVGERKDREI